MADSNAPDPTEAPSDVLLSRIGAQLIDSVFLLVQLFLVGFALTLLLGFNASGDFISYPYLTWATLPLYGGLLEGFWNGQTIGKRVVGITVVDQSGSEPGLGRAIVRNLPAAVLFGWPFEVIALASIAITDSNQRVFDLLAGTFVVEPGEVPHDAR